MFSAVQYPAPEGVPKPFGSAQPDGGSHPTPKPEVSKGSLGIIDAAVLTSERQAGAEEASLAPGLMGMG